MTQPHCILLHALLCLTLVMCTVFIQSKKEIQRTFQQVYIMVLKSKKKLFFMSDPPVLSHQNVPDPNVFAVHTVLGLSYFF